MGGCRIFEILGTPETVGNTCILLQVARSPNSEHRVVVGRGLWDRLDHVPMLNNPAALKPEDVNHSLAALTRDANPIAMHDDKVPVCENAFDVHTGTRIVVANPIDEFAQPVKSIFDHRIVLAVVLASVLCNCCSGVEFIKSLLVKGQCDC